MMQKIHVMLLNFWVLLPGIYLCAQHAPAPAAAHSTSTHAFVKQHSVGLALGHAHIFDGLDAEGNKKKLTLPMFGIDYNFQFAPKWMLGFHTDVVVETFAVEKHGGDEAIERNRPVAPALMIFYKPTHHWSFGLGAGAEFAKEADFFLNRLAVEYSAPIKNGWEVFGVFQNDIKWKAYDSWSLGIGIGKVLGKAHPVQHPHTTE